MAEYYQFAHSVQGYNHIKANKVCQDASGECHFEDVSIIAVADGHGSDNYIRTDRGSKFAVSAALTAIKASLYRKHGKIICPLFRILKLN